MSKIFDLEIEAGSQIHQVVFHLWENEKAQPSFTVFLIHGLGEHLQRYSELCEYFVQKNVRVIGIDLPGHGHTRLRPRGQKLIETDIMLELLDKSLEKFCHGEAPFESSHSFEEQRLCLLGHSLGGALGLRWLFERQNSIGKAFDRAYFSAPYLGLVHSVPFWKLRAAQLLKKLSPYFELSSEIKIEMLSSDIEKMQQTITDPLMHYQISPALFLSLERNVTKIWSQLSAIRTPVALAVGDQDQIASQEKIQKCHKALGGEKELFIYPACRHEIFNERIRQEIYTSVFEYFG